MNEALIPEDCRAMMRAFQSEVTFTCGGLCGGPERLPTCENIEAIRDTCNAFLRKWRKNKEGLDVEREAHQRCRHGDTEDPYVMGNPRLLRRIREIQAEKQKHTKAADPSPIKARAQKPSNIYMMIDDRNGYTKIGISKNPSVREKTLQSEAPEVRLVFSVLVGQPVDLEKNLHKRYGSHRVRGEWFDISKNQRHAIESAAHEWQEVHP